LAWLDKLNTFLGRSWMWIVGLGVSILAVYLVYKLRSQANSIKRLHREKARLAEEVRDLAFQAEVEDDLDKAQELVEKAEASYHELEAVTQKILDLESEVQKRKKEIDRATLWSELEEIADRDPDAASRLPSGDAEG
jgi:peptidoglycan hydrolase CwlO-like protein